jgi:hypothetical protein
MSSACEINIERKMLDEIRMKLYIKLVTTIRLDNYYNQFYKK